MEAFYMIAYCLLVFITLLNYLLAVIVGAYDNMKKEIENCKVEQNVVTDVYKAFSYFFYQTVNKWPDRDDIAQARFPAANLIRCCLPNAVRKLLLNKDAHMTPSKRLLPLKGRPFSKWRVSI